MQLTPMPDLRSYIETGDAITKGVIDSESSLYKGVETYYDFFRNELLSAGSFSSPIATLVFMNTCLLFASSIRMTLTGHAGATAPLFRTTLESACYAYLINQSTEAEHIWSNRHKDAESLRACRKYYGDAINKVSNSVFASDNDANFKQWLSDAYQAAIDFGAHPNPRSVFNHIDYYDRDDQYVQVDLIGLHHSESYQMHRHLIACLDYGLLIAVIIAKSLENPTDDLSKKLHALNELKEQLVQEYFIEDEALQ